jgi:hypothetical protein
MNSPAQRRGSELVYLKTHFQMDPKKLSVLDLDSLGAVWVEGHEAACNAL